MLISSLSVSGFSQCPNQTTVHWEAIATLPPYPLASVVVDALGLVIASLDADRAIHELKRLDIATSELQITTDADIVDMVEGLEPQGVHALTAEGSQRHVTVELHAKTDPVLYGFLRDVARREPRLATGLATGGALHVKLGWLFSRDGTRAAVSVYTVKIGGEGFATDAQTRPQWIGALLRQLGERIRVHAGAATDRGKLAATYLHAVTSPDPTRRARIDSVQRDLSEKHLDVGRLEIVYAPPRHRLHIGTSLTPARCLGPAVEELLALVLAARIESPDVLVVQSALLRDPAVMDWLHHCLHGDDASLEQIVIDVPT